jgi:hypothetical protein
MCTALSSQPNLDNIKKEARKLLHALQRRDAAAIARYYSIDSLADLSRPRLDDVQYIIAREHGYDSWQQLKEYLSSTSSSRSC